MKFSNSESKRTFIVDNLIGEIQNGKYGIGSALPSLNEICEQFDISRKTAVAAYSDLKQMGIIKSSPRKGYRVTAVKNLVKQRIFLLFDELSEYKKVLYNGFLDGIGRQANTDVFFHHFNPAVFEKTITENIGNYTAYVVMPFLHRNCSKVLKSIPEGKLYILDSGLLQYGETYPSVGQNFGKNIFDILTSAKDLLGKYNKFILVDPDDLEPDQIEGFHLFCNQNRFQDKRVYTTNGITPEKGECYYVIMDGDLVNLVNAARQAGLEIGKDLGIISFNETPWKSIAAGGITVMSTDFRKMGLTMADMVLNRKNGRIENPCELIRRNSL